MNKIFFRKEYLFICFILSSIYFIEMKKDFIRYSFSVNFTFFVIILYSSLKIIQNKEIGYSLEKIFYAFSLIFFGVAPLIQFLINKNMWGGTYISDIEYMLFNILILLILVLYSLIYKISYKMKVNRFEKKIIKNSQLISNKKHLLRIIISLAVFVLFLIYNKFNILGFLVRTSKNLERLDMSQIKWLFLMNFIRPIPAHIFYSFIQIDKRKKSLEYIILLILFVLTNSPFASSRYYVGIIYIPLILMKFKNLKKNNNFIIVFIFMFLYFFPFMENFRNFKSFNEIDFKFNFKDFEYGHFDSYQNFLRIVNNNLITNGYQLLTTIFFFIPRTIWASKGIGSGAYLAEKLNFNFNNISCNYFAEGFINFGFLGILFFLFIISYINARMDKLYWTVVLYKKNNLKNIYYYSLGIQFFILRGDLLSSIAYATGIIISNVIIFKIMFKKNKKL